MRKDILSVENITCLLYTSSTTASRRGTSARRPSCACASAQGRMCPRFCRGRRRRSLPGKRRAAAALYLSLIHIYYEMLINGVNKKEAASWNCSN